jgi:hypothetical protein
MLRGREKKAEATRLKAATDAEANTGREKCVSRPDSGGGGGGLANLAAIREAFACAGGNVAAVERILERKGLPRRARDLRRKSTLLKPRGYES